MIRTEHDGTSQPECEMCGDSPGVLNDEAEAMDWMVAHLRLVHDKEPAPPLPIDTPCTDIVIVLRTQIGHPAGAAFAKDAVVEHIAALMGRGLGLYVGMRSLNIASFTAVRPQPWPPSVTERELRLVADHWSEEVDPWQGE